MSIPKKNQNKIDKIDSDSPAFGKWEDLSSDEYLNGLQLMALKDMRRVFTYSSFTFLVSIFEGSLKRICDVFVDPAKINPEHLKGPSYTLQAQMFLSRGIGIQLPDPSKWEQLKKFVQIRNSIIHENAFVQKKAGKSFEGQSDKYKSVMAFKEFLTISENEESLSFTIEDISFIRRFGDGAQLLLNEIATKSIEHARAYYH